MGERTADLVGGVPSGGPPGDGALGAVTNVVQTLAERAEVGYVEVVMTVPTSLGATIEPTDVDVVRGQIVRSCRAAGAERATCILLVNPAEVPVTLSVLSLLRGGMDSADDMPEFPGLEEALDEALRSCPVERRTQVVSRAVGGEEVATLVDRTESWRRVDVALVEKHEEAHS